MDVLATTKQKIDAALDKIRALQVGHFAQHDSRRALQAIEAIFLDHQQTVALLANGASFEVVTNHCNAVLEELFTYLPILGFLHRSKNASNQFEVYDPLLRLAHQVIGPTTKLVMSSEWNFSPFTFLQMPRLPEYVLIGLPASEANNSLLTPLAGHEFGHTIWKVDRAEDRYRDPLSQVIVRRIRARWVEYQGYFPYIADEKALATDMFAVQTWLPALRWALRQCEEIFCDSVGLWLFGEAYLQAFAYLLAPGLAAHRVPYYPSITARVKYLVSSAKHFGIEVPESYPKLFEGGAPPPKTPDGFLTSLSDDATADQVDKLAGHVGRYMEERKVPIVDEVEVKEVLDSFKLMVPADNPRSLAAIVNAGWRASHGPPLWPTYKRVDQSVVLNELILKSAQVLEFRERTNDPAGK